VPIFKYCEAKCIVILVQCMRTRIFLPTEIIMMQGDIGSALYFIRMGKVEISISKGGDNKQQVINELGEFDFFGEQSFLMRMPSLAMVRAAVVMP
jgi:CRP-like cAMP-binding protein